MAIYRRSGVNTEGICFKSVGYVLSLYIYISRVTNYFKLKTFWNLFFFLQYTYIKW